MTVDDAAFVEKMAEREEVGIFGSPWVSLTRKERDRLAALARLAVNEANTAPGDLNRLSCGCWFRACSKVHEDSIAGEAQQRLADAEARVRELEEAGREMMTAADELMTEFVSKRRAAD